jgi:hypothetical protein
MSEIGIFQQSTTASRESNLAEELQHEVDFRRGFLFDYPRLAIVCPHWECVDLLPRT